MPAKKISPAKRMASRKDKALNVTGLDPKRLACYTFGDLGVKFFEMPEETPTLAAKQVECIEDLAGCGRLGLFAKPGTGKTLMALHAWVKVYDDLSATRGISEETLRERTRCVIVVPPIAVRNWYMWAAKVLHDENLYYDGAIQVLRTSKDAVRSDAWFVIVTYAVLGRREMTALNTLNAWGFAALICDESHNARTEGTNIVHALYNLHNGLTKQAHYFWPLTGTPMIRYADDLFYVLRAIDHEVLRENKVASYRSFLDQFCLTRRVRYGNMRHPQEVVSGNRNLGTLHDMVYGGEEPLALSLELEDVVSEFPPITFREVGVDYDNSAELQRLMDAVAMQIIDDDGVSTISAAGVQARHMLGAAKVPYVAEYVRDVFADKATNKDRKGVLVAFWHRQVGAELARLLKKEGYKVEVIDGSTPNTARERIEDDFNAGDLDAVIGQIQSMGVSLNLQKGGNHVVFAERCWSYEMHKQVWQRVYRLGQADHVQVDYCIADAGLEDQNSRVLDNKRHGADKFMEG